MTFFISPALNFMSAHKALRKEEHLALIVKHYYHEFVSYSGGDIQQVDVKRALEYAASKKGTKGVRQAKMGVATFTMGAAGAAIGGAAGSVFLGVGAVGGSVAVGTVVGSVPSAAKWGYRSFKGTYKALKGTRGKHRVQAGRALMYNAMRKLPNLKECQAAVAGLQVILEDDFATVMGEPHYLSYEKNLEWGAEFIAARLKSW